jgi:hypothetical protein
MSEMNELTQLFVALDRLYIETSKQGIAAHEAGNKQRKHRLETIAHHVYEARKSIALALGEAVKPTEGGGE